jgi:hypothetical protein
LVVCLSNEGVEAALEPRKTYRALPDPKAERDGLVRVVDESGEGHLYAAAMFEPLEVPERLAELLAVAC